MALTLAVMFGFIPAFVNAAIIYWLDRYEKEPLRLLGAVFIWGAVVAAGGAFVINTFLGVGVYIFTESEAAVDWSTGSLIAPVIEEGLKGLAVLLVYRFASREFDSILDGIVYAAVTALGFSATENVFYIYQHGYVEGGIVGLFFLAFVRVVLVGWQHPFYTAFTGIGLASARLSHSPSKKFIVALVGFVAAVLTHSIHNSLAFYSKGLEGLATTTLIDWTGWLVMIGFIVWMIRREKNLITRYLWEEIQYGTINPQQYATACSPAAQWRAIRLGLSWQRYRITVRFYQLCGEIVHKKHQLVTMGDEQGNLQRIDQLRSELRQLSPWIPA